MSVLTTKELQALSDQLDFEKVLQDVYKRQAAATWLTTRPKKAKAAAPAEAVEGGNV